MLLNPFKNIAFSKNWFEQFNYLFTFFLNNKKTSGYLREKLRLLDFDITVPIAKITPNSVHYEVSKDTFTAVCYSYDRIANLMKKEFENIFLMFHKFDERIANQFLPILNLGYDTLTVYSSTADGYVYHQVASWSSARNATTGSGVQTQVVNSTGCLRGTKSGSTYYIYRSFFYFDTSSIPDSGIEITSAIFSLYGLTYGGSSVTVQEGTQAATLTAADYDAFNGSAYGNTTNWSTTGYNDITFNALGMSKLNTVGTTLLCARERIYDFNNATPTGTAGVNGCYFSDYTGTMTDPKLVITYGLYLSTTRSYVY